MSFGGRVRGIIYLEKSVDSGSNIGETLSLCDLTIHCDGGLHLQFLRYFEQVSPLSSSQKFTMKIKHTKPLFGSKHTSLICFVTAVNIRPRIFFNNLISGFLIAPSDQGLQRATNPSRKRIMVTYNALLLLCFALFCTR